MTSSSSPIATEGPLFSPTECAKSLLNQKEYVTNQLGFRYVWSVRVFPRRLGPNGEHTILHISPKFSTVHEHISFQWTLKMYGTPEMQGESDDDEAAKDGGNAGEREREEEEQCPFEKGYVAITLYYLDGPMSTVNLKAQVRIAGERRILEDKRTLFEERNVLSVLRGHECELSFKDRAHLTEYVRHRIGLPIRLSLLLEMDAQLFRTDTYLNVVSPTPYHSFLTTNYRAKIGSKVWRKRSNLKYRARSASEGHSLVAGHKKVDLETVFNQVLGQESGQTPQKTPSAAAAVQQNANSSNNAAELMEKVAGIGTPGKSTDHTDNEEGIVGASPLSCPPSKELMNHPTALLTIPLRPSDLFKKLLIACCDSCERRASVVTMTLTTSNGKVNDGEGNGEGRKGERNGWREREADEEEEEEEGKTEEEEEENTFECDEENKTEVHDTLANMYFNTVVLPELEYVEDFVDFLIDVELSDLPVLKRACERYLCGELDSLPVMKSMTLTELCERYSELEEVDKLLEQEEYRNIDKRIRQICGERNLHDLVDECKRFREQCMRVQKVDLDKDRIGTKRTEGEAEEKPKGKSRGTDVELESKQTFSGKATTTNKSNASLRGHLERLT